MTDTAALSDILTRMERTRVLVVGDIMLDRFIYGRVERISPESPVPVLAIERETTMLGGAGNTLANLHGLGVKADLIALVGADEPAEQLRALVAQTGANSDLLLVDSARPSTIKTRYLAGHQQLLRSDSEAVSPAPDSIMQEALTHVERALETAQAVILSDYGKGFLRADFISSVIALARTRNLPVIVDPKRKDFSVYNGATAITPNKKELSEATGGQAVESDSDILAAAGLILKTCDIQAVIATRSADGITVVQSAKPPYHVRSAADIEVFDVSGAGDSVIATIAAALGAGADLAQAAELANLSGSIVVTKSGTAPILKSELARAVQQKTQPARIAPPADTAPQCGMGEVLGWDEAAARVRAWQEQGLRVGFTNGCFDILHKGHVSYLNNTRGYCDRLIVGLNHDASVKILKGQSRPIHDEDARATVLSALASVDLVVLFGAQEAGGDNTAISLLETLKPDVYFKGGDYTEAQIPEAPSVRGYGGSVQVMPVYEGHSTTGSVKKIQAGSA